MSINNNIEGQLIDQLQKLVEEIGELEDKLSKASKARERRKIQKALDDKKELYKTLTEESSAQQEDTPASSEETPAPATEDTPANSEETPAPATEEIPKAEDPKDNTPTTENTPKETKPKNTSKAPEAPKTQAPKVSAKDPAPAEAPSPTAEVVSEAGTHKTLIAIAIAIVITIGVVVSCILWSSPVVSTSPSAVTTTASAARYFITLSEVKKSFETSIFRTWDMEYKLRAEALREWVKSYRSLYVYGDHLTSSKEEAMLYAYGLAVSVYMENYNMEPSEAYRRVALSSINELKELLKDNYEDCEAVLRALQ